MTDRQIWIAGKLAYAYLLVLSVVVIGAPIDTSMWIKVPVALLIVSSAECLRWMHRHCRPRSEWKGKTDGPSSGASSR